MCGGGGGSGGGDEGNMGIDSSVSDQQATSGNTSSVGDDSDDDSTNISDSGSNTSSDPDESLVGDDPSNEDDDGVSGYSSESTNQNQDSDSVLGSTINSINPTVTTAPDVISSIVGSAQTKGNTVGGGNFSNVTNTLTDEDFGMFSSRDSVNAGYDNASKQSDKGYSWGPFGFGPRDLDPFGGRGPNVDSKSNVDTGSGRIGLGGTLFGGKNVTTVKSDLNIADMTKGKGYGRDFGPNLGNFMNTPNMSGVTPTEAMAKGTYSPYAPGMTKAGGQAPTYGVNLTDYNINKDGTVTASFTGKNEGFFGSTIGGIFGLITGSPVISALNTVGNLTNASKRGTFSTLSNMMSIVNPTVGSITTPISNYANFKGIDIDQMLGLGANQGYGTQSTSQSGLNDSGSGSINKVPELTSPSNTIRPIERPDTTPRDLIGGVGRRKRKAGEDVYGVAGSSPFLSYSDEIDTSGIGSFTGSARSGQFKQAPTGR
jgi:hypothetical protein